MAILVTGGTGTVGGHVVAGLLSRGVGVRCLVRSQDKAAGLPQGAKPVVGDLERPDALPQAFDGAEALFLLNALSQSETEQGLAAIEAAKSAGVRRIVYLSVPMPEGSGHIPHFRSKVPVEEAIRSSGVAYTILRPNNFFQNDLWFREAITQYGIYPQPIGSKGMNRVDVRDIAEVAVAALTGDGHAGREYGLHGPDALTSGGTAETWGRHLGREVRYGGDDLDRWEAQARQTMPEWMVHDLRVMYEYFQEHGFVPPEEEKATQRRVLGRDARGFDSFAAETAAAWRGR
jgi:uncharacterized protein YbjT (DUF2867 family)